MTTGNLRVVSNLGGLPTKTADPSPSAALERWANTSDPDEANLASHELALTYMMRGHLLARCLIAILKEKKPWDQRAIEGLVTSI